MSNIIGEKFNTHDKNWNFDKWYDNNIMSLLV